MNGIDPPNPLDPANLERLLDLNGTRARAFKNSQALNPVGAQKAREQAVTHRTPEVDKELDRLEAKYGLKYLYGDE